MNISEVKEGKKLTVYFEGDIDTTSAPQAYEYLQKHMEGVEELILDFSKLNYVSSAGLRVILFAQKTMSNQGKMVIRNVNSDIMETFELTCFTDLLTIE